MAIHFRTKTPKKLLATYKKAIEDGHVTTWSYDKEGDFTHTAEQWNKRAWLRPRVRPGEALTFVIVKPTARSVSSSVYAVYHGRFIESMLRHCDGLFTNAEATSMPDDGDAV